ncbi:VOC family protein [Rhizobium sp. KVB221]|uniref:VOC family protein n=1 Tax=Rhizobium setariae TaxID=2801340 RepID=A0A936YMR3_9HYPH|nr:VOC family protein [Rhizobium setariae]MBL0371582.1 VOC family protein [Rhizobium setariae]
MTSGLHHITLITGNVQANVDFYAGFLGLRLVKRTAGFEDATQLHLFYGDAVASPGSLVTFLVWENGSPGRVGHGAPSEISLAIRPEAIGFWLTRALKFGVKSSGPAVEFGEPVLRLSDPDGIIVKLVGVNDLSRLHPWISPDISSDEAIVGLRGATILSEQPEKTAAFVSRYAGFAESSRENAHIRLGSEAGSVIDVRDAGGFWTAAPGTGTIDHIAVRASDRAEVEAASNNLNDEAHGPVNVHDRKYFYSLYVREPSGTLLEIATDGPGFTADEPLAALGSGLFIPPHFQRREQDIKVILPQFGMPGEPRTVYRELPFVHRLHVPEQPDGSALFLLHGTAGNETSLLPLGRRLAPNATLIGLRGRSYEEGVARFFRRFDATTFDQGDVQNEAAALASFIEGATQAYDIDPQAVTFLGYSNGANLLGAAMLLQPGLIKSAILLRAMMVLEAHPPAELAGSRVLILSGKEDPYAPLAVPLAEALSSAGADVRHQHIPGQHELLPDDEKFAAVWLAEQS